MATGFENAPSEMVQAYEGLRLAAEQVGAETNMQLSPGQVWAIIVTGVISSLAAFMQRTSSVLQPLANAWGERIARGGRRKEAAPESE
ncbi:MAG: hypothetical protein AAFQ22_07100 [Pseudomonadota bacterium]